jgi:hypothetical protein
VRVANPTLRILAPLLLLLLTLPLFAACNSGSAEDSDPEALGRELTTRFLEILKEEDREKLGDFLAPAFQIARADGTSLDRAAYLANPARVNSYTIGENLSARRDGDLLTVRWTIAVDELIDGKPVPTAPAPRLSVFQRTDGKWKLLAHANFNAVR